MKPTARIITLLLSLLATGCATMHVSEQVGYNHDRLDAFDHVYADGEQLLISYAAFPTGGGPSVVHWAELDRKKLQWILADKLESQTPTYFSPHNGSLELPAGSGIAHIPLYNTLGSRWSPAMTDAIAHYSELMQRNDDSRLPFSAYNVSGDIRGVLLLIRDDPLRPHEIEVAMLAPEKESPYGPITRAVTYPFAVVFDVVTAPIQLLFYWGLRNMNAM